MIPNRLIGFFTRCFLMKKLLGKLLTIVLIIKCFLNNRPTLKIYYEGHGRHSQNEKISTPWLQGLLRASTCFGNAALLGPDRFLHSNVFRSCLYSVVPRIPDQNLAWTQGLIQPQEEEEEGSPLITQGKEDLHYIHKEDLQADLVP